MTGFGVTYIPSGFGLRWGRGQGPTAAHRRGGWFRSKNPNRLSIHFPEGSLEHPDLDHDRLADEGGGEPLELPGLGAASCGLGGAVVLTATPPPARAYGVRRGWSANPGRPVWRTRRRGVSSWCTPPSIACRTGA